MACLDVEPILLERLSECSFAEEGEGRMRKSCLQEVLVYENVELVRFDNDGHIKILILKQKLWLCLIRLKDKNDIDSDQKMFITDSVTFWRV